MSSLTLKGSIANSIESLVSSLQTSHPSAEAEDANDHNAIDILRLLRDESSKLYELQQLRDAIDCDPFGAFSTTSDENDNENTNDGENETDEEPNQPLPAIPKPKPRIPEIAWLKQNISIVSISRDSALLEEGASCSIIRAVLELKREEEVLRLVCCYERMPSARRRSAKADGDGDGDGSSSKGSTSTTSDELALLFQGSETDLSVSQSQNSRDGSFADGDVDAGMDDDPSVESKEDDVPALTLSKRQRQGNHTTKAEELTTHKRCKVTKSNDGSSMDGDTSSSNTGESDSDSDSDPSRMNSRTTSFRGGGKKDGDTNSTRISYTIDVSQNHGPLERLIDIHVNALGQCPSSEPALPMEEEEAQDYMQGCGLPSMDDDDDSDDDDDDDGSDRRREDENDNSWQSQDSKDNDVKNPSNEETQEANDSDSDLHNDTLQFLATHTQSRALRPIPTTDTFCAGINPVVLHDFVSFCSFNTDTNTEPSTGVISTSTPASPTQSKSGSLSETPEVAIYLLMTLPFYEQEWDVAGFLFDCVFPDEGDDDDDPPETGRLKEDSSQS